MSPVKERYYVLHNQGERRNNHWYVSGSRDGYPTKAKAVTAAKAYLRSEEGRWARKVMITKRMQVFVTRQVIEERAA